MQPHFCNLEGFNPPLMFHLHSVYTCGSYSLPFKIAIDFIIIVEGQGLRIKIIDCG